MTKKAKRKSCTNGTNGPGTYYIDPRHLLDSPSTWTIHHTVHKPWVKQHGPGQCSMVCSSPRQVTPGPSKMAHTAQSKIIPISHNPQTHMSWAITWQLGYPQVVFVRYVIIIIIIWNIIMLLPMFVFCNKYPLIQQLLTNSLDSLVFLVGLKLFVTYIPP